MRSYERLRRDCEPPAFDVYKVPVEAVRAFHLAMGEYILCDAHGLWLEPESQDGHCDPDELAYSIGSRIAALQMLHSGPPSGSPIESMLGACLLWLRMDWAGFPDADFTSGPDDYRKTFGLEQDGKVRFFLTPQAKIAGYAADFLMWFQCKNHVAGVAIECDGHNFHERTKEQASRDKRRDREILAAGFPVVRFTGSDIFKDPVGCARQVELVLADALERVSRAGGFLP